MSQVVVVNSIHRPLNRFRCVDAVPESDRGETEQDGDGTMKEKKRERSDEIQKIKADILVEKKVHHAQATYQFEGFLIRKVLVVTKAAFFKCKEERLNVSTETGVNVC